MKKSKKHLKIGTLYKVNYVNNSINYIVYVIHPTIV